MIRRISFMYQNKECNLSIESLLIYFTSVGLPRELFCFASTNNRSRVPDRKFQRFAITAIKNDQYFLKSMSVGANKKLLISVSSYGDAMAYAKTRRSKIFIVKPDMGCQGRGIYLTKHLKDIKPNERLICQVYIAKV